VYLTEPTAHLVEGFFELRDLSLHEIQGGREPVRVYALKGVGRMRTRLELAETRGLSAFVGRERELGVLEGALAQALEGNGQIVGVVGEAGVGKSRLCLEFVRACVERGLWVNEAHCPPHGKTEPFGAILQLLRGAFGLREDERDAEARERVAERLAELDAAFEESLPLVFDFLGMPDPERPAAQTDPQARERRLQRFVGQLVQARSRREPAVVFLDDAHWIDAPSDGFLAAIAGAVSGTRTLLLVNFRPEYTADWMGGSDYQQLPVRPLGPEDAEALLRERIGDYSANAELFVRIRVETGGNPFFLEEVVRSLAESGALEGEPGAYRLAEPVDSIAIPDTVQAVLDARIDRLPEREKHLLQMASVIGSEVPEALLAPVSELPETELDAALEHLRRAEFLHEAALFPHLVHAFKHPLTREVAYASQLSDRRMRTHAAVARALQDLYGDRIDPHAQLVAHHWREAGKPLDAAEWYQRAAQYLMSTSALQACHCLREMLPLVDGDLDSFGPVGHPERTRAGGLLLTACIARVGTAVLLPIPREEADALFERAKSLTEVAHDAGAMNDQVYALIMSQVEHYYGMALEHLDLEALLEHRRQAVTFAERSGDEAQTLVCCRALVTTLRYCGHPQEAYDQVMRQMARPPANPLILDPMDGTAIYLKVMTQGAGAAVTLGRPREALELLEYVASLARRDERAPPEGVDVADYVGHEQHVLQCEADVALGDGRRVVEYAQKILPRLENWGNLHLMIWTYLHLSLGHWLQRDWEEAGRAGERMAELIATTGVNTRAKPFADALAALARAHLGESQAARESTAEALAGVSDALPMLQAPVLRLSAQALLRSSGAAACEEIEQILDRMERLITETESEVNRPSLHALRAQLALVCGDSDTCERERAEAERLWNEMGADRHIQRMARDLEELSSRPGE
jgi:adenylate cyclase